MTASTTMDGSGKSASAERRVSMIRAFRLAGGAMAATTLLGVFTGKLVATIAGAEGVGLLGLYRMLGQLVVLAVSLEMGTLIVQRVAASATPEAARTVFHTAWRLFCLQIVLLLLVALLGPDAIARALFGPETYHDHVLEVRLVVAMTIGILALRLMTALLDGRLLLRHSTTANVVTSLATLLAAYPLLTQGRIGIALMLGSTCFVGAAYGAWHVWRAYELAPSDLRLTPSQTGMAQALPASPLLTLRAATMTGSLLAVQALVARFYGLAPLGWYNAAALVESSFLLILMSSMKSYFLPSLGRARDSEEEAALVNRFLALLLIVLLPCSVALLVIAPYILLVAFSSELMQATGVLAILLLSLPAQVVGWFYTIFTMHRLDYRVPLTLELGRAVLLVAGVWVVGVNHWPLEAAAAAYTISHWVSAAFYLLAVRRRYGRLFISRHNVLLILGLLLWLPVCGALLYPFATWPRPSGEQVSLWGAVLAVMATLFATSYLARFWRREEAA